MVFGVLDIVVFLGFIAAVITIGLWKSRHEKTSEDYFLAGRGLKWWLIGFSLIAANISSEQLVGMSGNAGVPHLHIETRIGPAGARFSGMRFYDTLATQQERDNYLLWRTSGVYRHFNPMDLLLYQLSP